MENFLLRLIAWINTTGIVFALALINWKIPVWLVAIIFAGWCFRRMLYHTIFILNELDTFNEWE